MLTINFTQKNGLVKLPNSNNKIFLFRNLRSNFFKNLKFIQKQQKAIPNKFPFNKALNFESLNVFYTIVNCGNIKLAAEHLLISQPAISLSISKLERELGVLLFRQLNSKNAVTLTPSGLILFNYTQRLFQLVEETIELTNYNVVYKSYYDLDKNYQIKTRPYYSLTLRKNIFCQTNKFLLSNTNPVSLKNFSTIHSLFLNHFEAKSRFLFSKYKSTTYNKFRSPFFISKNSVRQKIFQISKINSLNSLENKFTSSLKVKTVIEVQTVKAFNVCLELDIEDLIYWGAEL